MSKNILLDTDIVINLLRKQEIAVNHLLTLKRQGYQFYICPIVTAEKRRGSGLTVFTLVARKWIKL